LFVLADGVKELPIKVLLVTQGDPRVGMTGVATYVHQLSNALAGFGLEIAHCFSHSPEAGRPNIAWTVQGTRTIATLSNPPLERQFPPERAGGDIAHRAREGAFVDVLRAVCPDVVHFHDLTGLPANVLALARQQGCGVVLTLHDFWPFCRRQFLLRPGLIVCDGSAGGHHCARFCSVHPLTLRHLANRLEGRAVSWPLRRALRAVRGLRGLLRGGVRSQFQRPAVLSGLPWPDLSTVGVYAAREAAMRDRVLQAHVVLTVSEFAKSMYVRHGYPADRLRVEPLPATVSDGVRWRLREFRAYPVRFGFLGRVSPYKGAHLLAEAVAQIPPHRARCTFYGDVNPDDQRFLLALAGHHPGMGFAGRYTPDQLPAILDDIDVAVQPSVMRETRGLAGLEAQAAGLPIIASDSGALPEYVQHEVNGLVFPSGNVAALRTALLRIVEEPAMISRLSSHVALPPRMPDHAGRIVLAYREARELSAEPAPLRLDRTSGGTSRIGLPASNRKPVVP
jgi:glycosyltransferase involved in cell wall biosynthesis